MLHTTVEEAFEVNPSVSIKRGTEVPFVAMDQLIPGRRNVDTAEIREFTSGSKFESGDTLMARITPCLENKKIARYLPPKGNTTSAAGSTEFIVLRGKQDITTSEYAYYFAINPTIHDSAIALMTGTSGRQRVDLAAFRSMEIAIPPLATQQRITDILGSLDEKITANEAVVTSALQLQRAFWAKSITGSSQVALSEITSPILGGTPKRSEEALWEGTNLWASVADMTKAPHSHLVDTSEKISDEAIQTRRFSPLPAGSVLLSARGTVGHIVSTTKSTSFNQSAYGFVPPEGCGPALRLALLDVVAELKSKSYGSVFSTITKQQINECTVPDVFNPQFEELHTLLNTLESRIIAAELESQVLARTRDELLPLLMSGRITVGEAQDAADVAGTAASES